MKIINTQIYGLENSIVRSGMPMTQGTPLIHCNIDQNDIDRAFKLAKAKAGSGHDNFLKGIIVQFDLYYPEYFSPQLQRYHWVDIISSQSKMHKITSRELVSADFNNKMTTKELLPINKLIEFYNNDSLGYKEHTFELIINSLPSGYMKWMGISTNYLQLKTIYSQRKTHKLKEWRYFCKWIESLNYSQLIINHENKRTDRNTSKAS